MNNFAGQSALSVAGSAASSQLPAPGVSASAGLFSVGASVRPTFGFGGQGFSFSPGASLSGFVGAGPLSAGFGTTRSLAPSNFGTELRRSNSVGLHGPHGISLTNAQTRFKNQPQLQTIGTWSLSARGYSISTSNDIAAFRGDGGDRFRSANVQLGFPNKWGAPRFQAGFRIFTGNPCPDGVSCQNAQNRPSEDGFYTSEGARNADLRAGALYVGMRDGHRSYQVGAEGDLIRHLGQDLVVHYIGGWPYFPVVDRDVDAYTGFRSTTPFTSY